MHENHFEEKMGKFYDNIDKLNPDSKLPARCRSVYFIQKEDRDGNIIDEKYGINHMTDNGLVLFTHARRSAGSASYLSTLTVFPVSYNKFTITKSDVESSMQADEYNHYDPTTGYFYYIKAFGKFVIPYDHEATATGDGSSRNYDISQLGIQGTVGGTSGSYKYNIDNAFFSLSDIYDMDGNPIILQKNEHEKLTIYYYVSAGYRPDTLIPSLWNKGIYAFIDASQINFAYSSSMYGLCFNGAYISYMSGGNIRFGAVAGLSYDSYMWSTYEVDANINSENYEKDLVDQRPLLHNNTITSRTGISQAEIDASASVDDQIARGISLNRDPLCLSATKVVDETSYKGSAPYAFSAMTYYNNFVTSPSISTNSYHYVIGSFYASKESLVEFETIESDNIYTNNCQSPSLLYNFGYIAKIFNTHTGGYLPVYDFDIISLYMYNIKTHTWDITVNTNNATAKDNYYAEFQIFGVLNIKGKTYDNITRSINAYLFINIQPTVPIISFGGDLSSRIIYGTDEYWDMSQWELVSNNSAIQQTARNYKYYIFTGGNSTDDYNGASSSLYINRDRQDHSIVLSKYNYTLPIQWTSRQTFYKYSSNGWSANGHTNYGFSSYENHWFVANNTLYYVDPLKNETNDATAYTEYLLYGPADTPALMRSSYRYDGKYIMTIGRWARTNDPNLSTIKRSVRF